MALPRTPPPAIVRWYQQEPILQSDLAIDATDTDTSASRAWVHVGQPVPKTALKASHKILYRPEECLGSHGARLLLVPDRDSAVWSRIATIRRATLSARREAATRVCH